jgi:hypothetical protein
VAIAGQTVSIPAFRSFASVNYTFGIGTAPAVASVAAISNWAYSVQFVHRLHAIGLVTTLYGTATIPPLRVLH